jgi:4-hydroxy-tetrahydrodipicolinate synthase
MVPLPSLFALDDLDALTYFEALANRGAIPIVVQDAPAVTGTPISVGVLARLLEHPRVVAVKVEAVPSAPKITALAEATGNAAGILGGGGGIEYWHELLRGASGTMPSSAVADILMAVHRSHAEDDFSAGRELFARLVPLLAVSLRTFDTYVTAQKLILTWRGLMESATLRRPHEPHDALLGSELEPLWRDLAWDARGTVAA